MPFNLIPTRSDIPHYDMRVTLDGTEYYLELRYNTRDEHWFLALYDSAMDVIAAGVRVVVGFPLLFRCQDARRPPGMLLAVSSAEVEGDPGETDLGGVVQLYYIDAADLPVLAT
jgi:hypothetical protein